jgi:hypothetical protein
MLKLLSKRDARVTKSFGGSLGGFLLYAMCGKINGYQF